MNTAQDLLETARASGYTLTLREGGKLIVKPPPPAELLAELRTHKPELLELLSSSPANEPPPAPTTTASTAPPATVAAQQAAFLGRPALVSEADLLLIQRKLLPHLAECRDCCTEGHLYCRRAERTGNGYAAFLLEFPDSDARHHAFVSAVIKARISGLKAGFIALEALTHGGDDAPPESQHRPSGGAAYGIERRPAELAFVNHFSNCTFCFPRSGKYCAEGRQLHEAAMQEGMQ